MKPNFEQDGHEFSQTQLESHRKVISVSYPQYSPGSPVRLAPMWHKTTSKPSSSMQHSEEPSPQRVVSVSYPQYSPGSPVRLAPMWHTTTSKPSSSIQHSEAPSLEDCINHRWLPLSYAEVEQLSPNSPLYLKARTPRNDIIQYFPMTRNYVIFDSKHLTESLALTKDYVSRLNNQNGEYIYMMEAWSQELKTQHASAVEILQQRPSLFHIGDVDKQGLDHLDGVMKEMLSLLNEHRVGYQKLVDERRMRAQNQEDLLRMLLGPQHTA